MFKNLIKKIENKIRNIPSKNISSIQSLHASGTSIFFINSFPRSGNTWVRNLLSDIILQLNGFNTATKLEINPDNIVPDITANLISDCDSRFIKPNLYIKSHDELSRIKLVFKPNDTSNFKFLYIYRNPTDSLTSFYHFHLRYDHLKHKAQSGPDVFCSNQFNEWSNNLNSYIKGFHSGEKIKFVSYESLLLDPIPSIQSILAFLEIQADLDIIEKAVANNSFKKLQEVEKQNPINEKEFFFRKGIIGSGKEELSESFYNEIIKKAEPLLSEANTIMAAQGIKIQDSSI